MSSCWLNNMVVTTEKEARGHGKKSSEPVRYGKYTEIRTRDYEFQFNQAGEVKFIRGLATGWPHPSERLKRTDGNDWVYYTVGKESGSNGIISWMGEYYLPCLPYPSNSIWDFNPFIDPNIMQALGAWSQLSADLYGVSPNAVPPDIHQMLSRIRQSDENTLYQRSRQLFAISGERISVLPPDARHVDYEVIPIVIADGCLYHCSFCCVQSQQRYQPRSQKNIREQIDNLKSFNGPRLENYHALFLGNHDALGAGTESICMAAVEAFKAFGFERISGDRPKLYLFGSVDSLLRAGNELFTALNGLPYSTCINIGFESVDQQTLKTINKPLSVSKIDAAFQKMLSINKDYSDIEMTGNFLIGEGLSHAHHQSLADFLESAPGSFGNKGAVYLSPLMGVQQNYNALPAFFEVKSRSHVPAYIYLIQRL
jgi:hypothetical protein